MRLPRPLVHTVQRISRRACNALSSGRIGRRPTGETPEEVTGNSACRAGRRETPRIAMVVMRGRITIPGRGPGHQPAEAPVPWAGLAGTAGLTAGVVGWLGTAGLTAGVVGWLGTAGLTAGVVGRLGTAGLTAGVSAARHGRVNGRGGRGRRGRRDDRGGAGRREHQGCGRRAAGHDHAAPAPSSQRRLRAERSCWSW